MLGGDWPGVADPEALRAQLADWLAQYANAGTRRTYAYALGLPVAWVDLIGGAPPAERRAGPTPPPAPRGPLHHLAWFRWCAARALDPRAATGREVKAWLHALDAAGASRRTRQRMLSTLSALYGHLTETGAVAANPAALHRGRLGLSSTARDASPTVRLTAAQLRALLLAAGGLAHTRDPRLHRLYATRAVAFVALLTLGLRISELVGLDRGDLYRSGGDDVLRVLGKGGHHREVYVTDLAAAAVGEYLAERDRVTGTGVPALRGRTAACEPARRHPRRRPLRPGRPLHAAAPDRRARRARARRRRGPGPPARAAPRLRDDRARAGRAHPPRAGRRRARLDRDDPALRPRPAHPGHHRGGPGGGRHRGRRSTESPQQPDDRDGEQVSASRGLTGSAARTTRRDAVPDRFMTRRR